MKVKFTWGPWEWGAFKPDCLFCVEKATDAAKASHAHIEVSIRCCKADVCRALALQMVKDHLRFMVNEPIEEELLN